MVIDIADLGLVSPTIVSLRGVSASLHCQIAYASLTRDESTLPLSPRCLFWDAIISAIDIQPPVVQPRKRKAGRKNSKLDVGPASM